MGNLLSNLLCFVYCYFVLFGHLLATMDAISAAIVARGWARFWLDIELGRNKLITRQAINDLILNSSMVPSNRQVALALDWTDLLKQCCRRGQRLDHVDDVCWMCNVADIRFANCCNVATQQRGSFMFPPECIAVIVNNNHCKLC